MVFDESKKRWVAVRREKFHRMRMVH